MSLGVAPCPPPWPAEEVEVGDVEEEEEEEDEDLLGAVCPYCGVTALPAELSNVIDSDPRDRRT
jgi:hypothetical protein